jgi:uncharacterized protein YkwD
MVSLVIHWFTPHYTNNHRPKLLQPAGLSVVVALFMLVQTSLQLVRMSPMLPGGFVLGYASSISPSQVVEMTNARRSEVGLSALVVNEKLNQAAQAKAAHMFANDYWAHIAPDGTTPWMFIKNAGYGYSVAGENLARDFGDSGSMMQAWMESSTHRANIMHQKYTQIGIAVVDGKLNGVETTLVVQMFGTPTNLVAKTSAQAASSEKVNKEIKTVVPKPEIPPVVEVAALEPTLVPSKQVEPMVSPLTVTKIVSTILIVLLVLVLTYDSLLSSKKKLPRKVGNNWAHIGLFGVVLLIIIAMTQGRVL